VWNRIRAANTITAAAPEKISGICSTLENENVTEEDVKDNDDFDKEQARLTIME
jgi:hypothetical protein